MHVDRASPTAWVAAPPAYLSTARARPSVSTPQRPPLVFLSIYWASLLIRPVTFFSCSSEFRLYSRDNSFTEKPSCFMHLITHKWCIGLK